ncbi:glycosyltransferase family 1 protein [Saccharothrix violaceirubra]|uniref:Glycosyltransferase involved in cell wall biosynthesis n=1 Tax=Saccharothrix violaceirubra TaxID=413306 RepID=A0A7W7WX74_9PSEU|nr:glycosyltransferase family 1 protein [Saccharothrix violaceirubra]MBB4967144.1 glycosyltransferase involved in cell wall biosynthesis [Saccharothrix violaceirubra]
MSIARSFQRRAHQVSQIVREQGVRTLGARALQNAARRFGADSEVFPVRLADVRAADVSVRKPVVVPPIPADGKLTVNWISTPPAPGSGGHTTMFRLIRHLESLGHTCRLYLYDVYGSRAVDHEPTVRAAYPDFRGPVLDVTEGMADAHAVFASAWMTCYPAFNDPAKGKRFYLVQDYEPWFFPVGGLSALAENTYKMGFHGFTAGRFLTEKLREETGMAADWFDFGCDVDRYRLHERTRRDGVVFYARRLAPRRAIEIGLLALEIFAERHPDVTIHTYGEKIGSIGPRHVDHGLVTPDRLNEIYNRSYAGLSLSMTNVSLVPHEMLAAGCVPVVNDAHHNRVVLDNEHVVYAPATPHDLARALSKVVTTPDFDALARTASASVAGRSWDAAGHELEKVLRRELLA